MIIQDIILENFLCYYDIKPFPLSKGLNIILGENGEGKTKFFEALEWLFKGDNSNLEQLVSAKKLAEVAIDEVFKVKVAITVKQYEEIKTLSRYFTVRKTAEAKCSPGNVTLEGVVESISGERSLVDGQRLMDQLFPPTIRKYSLFKGEAELDIFKSEDALINLINSFSEAKYYDKYAEKAIFLKSEAEKAVENATKKETNKKTLYQRLENEIQQLEDKKISKLTLLNLTNENIRKTRENLDEVANHIDNAEALETINKRITNIDERISSVASKIDEDYTTFLFDEKWILLYFESFHQEYAHKVKALSKTVCSQTKVDYLLDSVS